MDSQIYSLVITFLRAAERQCLLAYKACSGKVGLQQGVIYGWRGTSFTVSRTSQERLAEAVSVVVTSWSIGLLNKANNITAVWGLLLRLSVECIVVSPQQLVKISTFNTPNPHVHVVQLYTRRAVMVHGGVRLACDYTYQNRRHLVYSRPDP